MGGREQESVGAGDLEGLRQSREQINAVKTSNISFTAEIRA